MAKYFRVDRTTGGTSSSVFKMKFSFLFELIETSTNLDLDDFQAGRLSFYHSVFIFSFFFFASHTHSIIQSQTRYVCVCEIILKRHNIVIIKSEKILANALCVSNPSLIKLYRI